MAELARIVCAAHAPKLFILFIFWEVFPVLLRLASSSSLTVYLVVPGIELRALCMLGKCSITSVMPQPFWFYFGVHFCGVFFWWGGAVLGFELMDSSLLGKLEPSTSPGFFFFGIFEIGSLTLYPGLVHLQSSRVTRIIGVSHWCLAWCFCSCFLW
jgi:hypothetical protein